MIRAALGAAALGFEIFPVSPAKTPLTAHGHLNATTDSEQIRRWWRANPDANIGARCTWFFVVDVDPRGGGHHVLDGWRRVRGEFPRTWTQRTGSGGLHIFFRHDEALDSVPLGKLHHGLDIKGGGRGYVLLSPSRNTKGVYTWLVAPQECELSRAPRWLVNEITAVKRPKITEAPPVDVARFAGVDRVERARRYAQRIPGAMSGADGHTATFRTAMLIARGFALTEQEAFAVLTEWNLSCSPPWPAHLLQRKVREAMRVGSMPIGALLEKGRAA